VTRSLVAQHNEAKIDQSQKGRRMALLVIASTLFALPAAVAAHHSDAVPDVFLDVDGDLKLGAIFPIHKRGTDQHSICGEIQKEDGFLPLEALLFTIDEINSKENLLPGLKLGVRAVDSCDSPYFAAEKSLGLIQGFISRKVNFSCSPTKGTTRESPWPCGDNIIGLIGPQTSSVSIQVAGLGRIFRIPQVSYLATSAALCNREKFPYFFRTVPSDKHQARAIVGLLDAFGWSYASIVHSDSEYGLTGYRALADLVSEERGLCLADPFTIYNDHFAREDYRHVVKRLLANRFTKVVIVFADRVPAGRLLEAARELGVTSVAFPRDSSSNGGRGRRILWIGSDAWASRESVVAGRESVVEGAIAVQPLRRELPGYSAYMWRILKEGNRRNPWFKEYYEHYHGKANCTGSACLKDATGAPQLYVHFVRDAVYAFAHAVHNLHNESCGGFDGQRRLCDDFRRRIFSDALPRHLKNARFPDVAGHEFQFQGCDGHDGPPRYSVINFQRIPFDFNGRTLYDWRNVAMFYEGEFFEWNRHFRERLTNDTSISKCLRKPCGNREVKVQDTEDLCCWHCRPCNEFEFKASDYECRRCPPGYRSDGSDGSHCLRTPETYLDYSDPWALASILFALAGMALTLVTVAVFWLYWETPVVKACGRELSLLLVAGTFLSFVTTFAVVAPPSKAQCGLVRFFIGFCYTVCYAAVVTKTNRVSRIFAAKQGATSAPRFTSPLSSVLIACALISVEVVVNTAWLLLEPPATTHLHNFTGQRILVCAGVVSASFVTGLLYPFFLVVCATVYAFRTRKCPGGFNETRSILFANTINVVHWIVYVPLYFASTDPEIRAVILAFSLSLSGMVQLASLLMPKVYIVIFKPEKNTRGGVMHNPRHTQSHIPQTPPNSMALPGVVTRSCRGGSASLGAEALRTQLSVMSAPPGNMDGSMGPEHDSPIVRPAGSTDFAGMRARQMTWSFNSDTGGPIVFAARTRSSSVCKATQTTTGGRTKRRSESEAGKRITFTVSAPSDEEEEGSDDLNADFRGLHSISDRSEDDLLEDDSTLPSGNARAAAGGGTRDASN